MATASKKIPSDAIAVAASSDEQLSPESVKSSNTEEWRLCKKAPLYEVSSTGQIRHRATQTLVKPCPGKGPIIMVDLAIDSAIQKLSLAHLILEAFVDKPTEKHFYIGFHDNNPKNLNFTNLYWSDTFIWPKF